MFSGEQPSLESLYRDVPGSFSEPGGGWVAGAQAVARVTNRLRL